MGNIAGGDVYSIADTKVQSRIEIVKPEPPVDAPVIEEPVTPPVESPTQDVQG